MGVYDFTILRRMTKNTLHNDHSHRVLDAIRGAAKLSSLGPCMSNMIRYSMGINAQSRVGISSFFRSENFCTRSYFEVFVALQCYDSTTVVSNAKNFPLLRAFHLFDISKVTLSHPAIFLYRHMIQIIGVYNSKLSALVLLSWPMNAMPSEINCTPSN